MNTHLSNLIDLFLKKVSESEEIMKAHFGVDEPRLFRQYNISRVGEIDKYKYCFHGVGCRFSYKKVTIDYDYGDGGRIDGFDLWRLSQFGEQLSEFREYIQTGAIQTDFEQCIDNSEFVRSGGKYDDLFYLSGSI